MLKLKFDISVHLTNKHMYLILRRLLSSVTSFWDYVNFVFAKPTTILYV